MKKGAKFTHWRKGVHGACFPLKVMPKLSLSLLSIVYYINLILFEFWLIPVCDLGLVRNSIDHKFYFGVENIRSKPSVHV